MVQFALACNYEGDYAIKLLMVDSENTMAEVAGIAKDRIAGVFVREPGPDVRLRVRRHGKTELLPDDLKISDAGFIQMETVDVIQTPAY